MGRSCSRQHSEEGEFDARVRLALTRDWASLWASLAAIRRPGEASQVVDEQAESDGKPKAAKRHMRDEQLRCKLGKAHAQTVSEVHLAQLVEGVHGHVKAGGLTDENVRMDRRLDAT